MEQFDQKALTEKLIRLFGSVKNAGHKLGIHPDSLSPSKFRKLSDRTRKKILADIAAAEHPVDMPNEGTVVQQETTRVSIVQSKQIPTYDPGQEGITFASKMIRLTVEILLSFSMMDDMERRRTIRAILDKDLVLLLHAIQVHASDHPGEVAQLLKNEELLQHLGLTTESMLSIKQKKRSNS